MPEVRPIALGGPGSSLRFGSAVSAAPILCALTPASFHIGADGFCRKEEALSVLEAAKQSTATFKTARNAIAKARDELAQMEKTIVLPKPDPTDMVAYLRRQEIHNHLRAGSP
jgi:hypothetical protein